MATIEFDFVSVKLPGTTVSGSWKTQLVRKGGHQFVMADKLDHKFMKFVGRDTEMLDHITRIRNNETLKMMHAILNDEEDPRAPVDPGTPTRPRRELIDEIESSFVTNVACTDGSSYSFRVLTSANATNKLGIECTPEALTCLTKQPVLDHALGPQMVRLSKAYPDVSWLTNRSSCKTSYYDIARQCKRQKTMKVEPGPNIQDRANAIARILQEYHDAHPEPNDQENNNPNVQMIAGGA